MKTTVDIHDVLLARAKRHARDRGKTLRQVIEAGLRAVLDEPPSKYEYDWPDLSVGEPGAPYPLDAYTWQDLSELIYRREPAVSAPEPGRAEPPAAELSATEPPTPESPAPESPSADPPVPDPPAAPRGGSDSR